MHGWMHSRYACYHVGAKCMHVHKVCSIVRTIRVQCIKHVVSTQVPQAEVTSMLWWGASAAFLKAPHSLITYWHCAHYPRLILALCALSAPNAWNHNVLALCALSAPNAWNHCKVQFEIATNIFDLILQYFTLYEISEYAMADLSLERIWLWKHCTGAIRLETPCGPPLLRPCWCCQPPYG